MCNADNVSLIILAVYDGNKKVTVDTAFMLNICIVFFFPKRCLKFSSLILKQWVVVGLDYKLTTRPI